jgi:hypothetical protein
MPCCESNVATSRSILTTSLVWAMISPPQICFVTCNASRNLRVHERCGLAELPRATILDIYTYATNKHSALCHPIPPLSHPYTTAYPTPNPPLSHPSPPLSHPYHIALPPLTHFYLTHTTPLSHPDPTPISALSHCYPTAIPPLSHPFSTSTQPILPLTHPYPATYPTLYPNLIPPPSNPQNALSMTGQGVVECSSHTA